MPSSPTSNGGDDAGAGAFPALMDSLPEPLSREAVPRFLDPYGYRANSAFEWGPAPIPEMTMQVSGHKKVGGHVYYRIECTLAKPGQWNAPFLKWTAARRLGHLREGLHDPVKSELGAEYRTKFQGTHFAHKVAVRGTTSRLDGWCKKLAEGLNNKDLPPVVASTALRLLMPGDGDQPGALDAAGEGATRRPQPPEGGSEADANNPFAGEEALSGPVSPTTLSRSGAGAGGMVATPVRQGGTMHEAHATSAGKTGSEYSDNFDEYVSEGGQSTSGDEEEDARSAPLAERGEGSHPAPSPSFSPAPASPPRGEVGEMPSPAPAGVMPSFIGEVGSPERHFSGENQPGPMPSFQADANSPERSAVSGGDVAAQAAAAPAVALVEENEGSNRAAEVGAGSTAIASAHTAEATVSENGGSSPASDEAGSPPPAAEAPGLDHSPGKKGGEQAATAPEQPAAAPEQSRDGAEEVHGQQQPQQQQHQHVHDADSDGNDNI